MGCVACIVGVRDQGFIPRERRTFPGGERLFNLACGNERACRPLIGILLVLALAVSSGCNVERRRSDSELGLNPQQAIGRKIYDHYCDRCHEPYSTKGKKGPGLKGMFQKQYLPLSGLPANDERVTDIIRLGRNEMPAFSRTLNQQQIADLLAYLHRL